MRMDTPPQVPDVQNQYPETRRHPLTLPTYSQGPEGWGDEEMGTENGGVWDAWEKRVMSRVHKEHIQLGMMGMQERPEALTERLERLELSHLSSFTM